MVPTVTRLFDALAAPFAVLSGYCIISLYGAFGKKRTAHFGAVVALIVVAAILVTNVPLYWIDHLYAASISSTRQLFGNVYSGLVGLSDGANFTAYIENTAGFRLVTYNDMQFISSYNKNDSFFAIGSVDNGIVVGTCPAVLPSANSYLIDIIPGVGVNSTMVPGISAIEWLSNNCTLELQKVYSQKVIYGNMIPDNIYVYAIKNT
ncbi:MAG: hypothetical protein QXW10_01070 [Candidatus Micrarchaeaceae archaeon]